jgi:hypothetical protein
MSVSQRNPIDYYYYENPSELITTTSKDVPLNEHNEEVLRVSLSWAVFDYLAANFGIDWELKHKGNKAVIEGGDGFKRDPEQGEQLDWAPLTAIREQTNEVLQMDTRRPKLTVLEELVHDNAGEIQDYLRGLLDYRYCELCGLKYGDSVKEGDACQNDDCGGSIRHAGTVYDELVGDAVDEFPDRYIYHYLEYTDELYELRDELYDERRELDRERRQTRSDERADELATRIEDLRSQESVIDDHLTETKKQKYSEFLRTSRSSKYGFNMRSVSDSVGVTLVKEGYERKPLDDDQGRSSQMAIRELHPGAAYLDENEIYVVARAEYDDFESTRIRQTVREAGADEHLAEEFVCPSCHSAYELGTEDCEQCSADVPLKPRKLAVLDSVSAYRDDLSTASDGSFPARDMYSNENSEIQSTYCKRETSILSFDTVDEFALTTPDGTTVGTIKYGDVEVLVHTDSYRAKYKSGAYDSQETLFERCGHEGCPGVIARDDDGEGRCTVDVEHDPDGFENRSEFVRLGYEYSTSGVRVELHDDEEGHGAHTLTHGLRVALQYLGGVDIRELTEVVDDDSTYLFDTQEGGAQITRLLVDHDNGEYKNFAETLSLIEDHFTCDCESGCPLCLFQYGCATYNDPETLDKSRLSNLVGKGLTLTKK